MHLARRLGGILLLVFLVTLGFPWCRVALAQGIERAIPSVRSATMCDLLAVSVQVAPQRVPIWNAHAQVEVTPEGETRIIPPQPIIPGRFAAARFIGEDAGWKGFDTLVLDIVCEQEGRLVIVLAEHDNGKRENYSLLAERLRPGGQIVRWRLANGPDGDLSPSGLTRDGAWNPETEKGVHMILADYPRGFAIEGMRLEQSVPVKEGAVE